MVIWLLKITNNKLYIHIFSKRFIQINGLLFYLFMLTKQRVFRIARRAIFTFDNLFCVENLQLTKYFIIWRAKEVGNKIIDC